MSSQSSSPRQGLARSFFIGTRQGDEGCTSGELQEGEQQTWPSGHPWKAVLFRIK